MDILIILGLLLLNGLLAMSEIAIVSARKVRLRQAADKGDARAAAALALADDPSRFLSTVQVGITLVGIFAGAYGEKSLAADVAAVLRRVSCPDPAAEILALGIVVITITYFSIVIGELVPKRLAVSFPDAIACGVALPMTLLARVGRPVVAVLTCSTDAILKLLRIPEPAEEDEVSEDDVRAMIDRGAETGVFHEAEKELLDRVLRLDDLSVKSLMVPRADIVWIEEDATVERIRIAVATSPFSHFPVCRGGLDNLIGVVHVKDLVKHGLIVGADFRITDLARPPLFVPETMPALQMLSLFRTSRMHIGFLVDEYGGMEGLITLNDIVQAVVGETPRLGEEEEPSAVRREDGSWLVDAQLSLDDFARLLDRNPHDLDAPDGVHNIAGLILAALGHIPRTGEAVTRWGLRIEVVDMDRHRIDKVLVSPVPGSDLSPEI